MSTITVLRTDFGDKRIEELSRMELLAAIEQAIRERDEAYEMLRKHRRMLTLKECRALWPWGDE